jgi:lycopene cyclase domain-containing protein
VRHFTYVAVLLGCVLGAAWVVPVLGITVLRPWRRLLTTLAVVVVVFVGVDIAAIRAGYWWFDREQTVGVLLPGGLPVEELAFFIVVPTCAILGFEAVRTVLSRRAPRR